MSWENKIRRSVEESERLFASKPVPQWSEPARWGPGVAVAAALVVIAVFGLVAIFTQSTDSAPAVSSTQATSTTMQATTTVVDTSGVEPLRLDGGVSLISVEMDDETRIAVLVPNEVVPGRVEVDTDATTAQINADGFEANLFYEPCPGDLQDRGSLNARGSLIVRTGDTLTVCRPDQFLILEVTSNTDISDQDQEAFDIVPVDLGSEYLKAIEPNMPFCCDAFGPLRAGSLVITANRFTSGQVNAWDHQTLMPAWTTDIGEYSMLLGLKDDLVIATEGRGGFVALDVSTGDVQWEAELLTDEEIIGVENEEANIWYISTEFPITGSTAAPRLYAFDMESGTRLWMAEGRPETNLQWADPAIFPNQIVVMDTPRFVGEATTTTSHLLAFDRATGEPIWSTDLGDTTEAFSDRLLASDPDRGILIAATPAGEVFSVDPETGRIIWQTETGFSRIIEIGTNTIRLQQENREVELDLQTGERIGG
jgi:outer membrane protein assembly factor BamB